MCQVVTLCKAFRNNCSANIKLSKTQISKRKQWDELLCRFLSSLIKIGLTLIKNVIKTLAEIVFILIGLTAVASAAVW